MLQVNAVKHLGPKTRPFVEPRIFTGVQKDASPESSP
jgi:hypothetical protein